MLLFREKQIWHCLFGKEEISSPSKYFVNISVLKGGKKRKDSCNLLEGRLFDFLLDDVLPF